MKTLSKLGLTAVIAFGMAVDASALLITPTTTPQWTGTDNSNLNASQIDAIVDPLNLLGLTLTELYKQDVANKGEAQPADQGAFAGSYQTTFSPDPEDPANAFIDYVSGPYIANFTKLYLYVKDGNQNPAFYIFDISGWNGTDDLNVQGFWPAQGAISHVTILGGGGTTSVPDGGATIALLGLALGAVGYVRRKLTA